ncbi:glycosyltransferase family 87 protein [Pseudonocardia acidicola]|uniref:glycosyltransferase family 87 protein n=1 Tax=Pseudonocardia acidicola TaxID=2724939 RepID=UPI001B7D1758
MNPGPIGVRGLLILLVAATALATAGWLYVRGGSFALDRITSPEVRIHSDFDSFWESAVAMANGTDIYRTAATYPNLNPPLLTFLLAPLGLLGFLPAYRLFVLVTVALVVASMAAVASELRLRGGAPLAATVAVLLSSPVLGTLGLGQIYGLLTAGLAGSWIAGRRGHPSLEGVALGLTIAIKPSLAPVLLLPALRRRWPTLRSAVVTGVVGTAAGVAAAGPASFGEWLRLVLGKPLETYFDNASLPATVVRLTSVNDWGRPLVEVPGGRVVGLLVAAALLLGTAWWVRRPTADGAPDPALWALAAAALLASPLTWHNYLMMLMPGVLVLLARGRWPAATLLLSLSLIGMEWPPLWYGADGTASALPLSLYCGILLTYWAALLSAAGPDRAGAGVPPDGSDAGPRAGASATAG